MLRISGGHARGRGLAEPVPSGVRPTSSRVREALFSLVGQDLHGQRVLDAFGGTGLLGLEAWSRGASVVGVDRAPAAVRVIRANADALGADTGFEVLRGDVLALAQAGALGVFDGVLVDPPYALDPAPILDALGPCTTDWLVLETDARTEAPAGAGALALDRRRVYGATALAVYRCAPAR